jgi:hypothetical protein
VGRQDVNTLVAVDGTTVTKSFNATTGVLTLSAPGGGGGVPEAPNDSNVYGRSGLAWTNLGALYAPISHTHTIANVTGLQTALDGKAAFSHTHVINDVTGLQTALDGKAALSHTHTASEVTDFSEAVDDRVAALLVQGSGITLNYNDVANTLTISSTGGSPPVENGYVDDTWINPFIGFLAAGAAHPANTITFIPFKVVRDITVDGLGARVTTSGAGANCQLAIYANNNTTGRPTGNPLINTGNISVAATGTVSEVGLTPVTLTANTVYWAACNLSAGGPIFQAFNGAHTGTMTNFIGSSTLANISSGTGTGTLHLRLTQTFGTWPDVTSDSFTENTANSVAIQFLRISNLP